MVLDKSVECSCSLLFSQFSNLLGLAIWYNSALLLVDSLMHCGLGCAFLGEEFVHEILFFVNRLSEVLIKLIGAIFFIAVMNKTHAVAQMIGILTMHGISLVLKVVNDPQAPYKLGHVFIGKVDIKTIDIKTLTAVDVPNGKTVTFYIGVVAHPCPCLSIVFGMYVRLMMVRLINRASHK